MCVHTICRAIEQRSSSNGIDQFIRPETFRARISRYPHLATIEKEEDTVNHQTEGKRQDTLLLPTTFHFVFSQQQVSLHNSSHRRFLACPSFVHEDFFALLSFITGLAFLLSHTCEHSLDDFYFLLRIKSKFHCCQSGSPSHDFESVYIVFVISC